MCIIYAYIYICTHVFEVWEFGVWLDLMSEWYASRCWTWSCLTTRTRCNTLQHAATHCSSLQHTVTHCSTLILRCFLGLGSGWGGSCRTTTTHCNTLQRTATHCNALQHTATHCNTLQHTDFVVLPGFEQWMGGGMMNLVSKWIRY